MSLIWGSDNIGKPYVRKIYERPRGDKKKPQDLVIGGEMVVSRGVKWPLLEIIKAQPICWYMSTLGIKGVCFLMKIAIPLL